MNNIFLVASLGYENVLIKKIKDYKEKIISLENDKNTKWNTLTDIQQTDLLQQINNNSNYINQTYTQISQYSGMSTNEIKTFFEENDIISTSKDGDSFNATIFRNKITNEIEITVGGTEGTLDLVEDAGIVLSGYSLTQSNKLNNLIQQEEESGSIKSTDKINFYGHSLGKGIIETTLMSYYGKEENQSKLEQINQLNYVNGVSVSKNTLIGLAPSDKQEETFNKIQNTIYDVPSKVLDVVVDTGFDMVPNAGLTGLWKKTLIANEETRIGQGFDNEGIYINMDKHSVKIGYRIYEADELVKENNLSEKDKLNLYNIFYKGVGQQKTIIKNKDGKDEIVTGSNLGNEIEIIKNLVNSKLTEEEKSNTIKTLDGLTNIGKIDIINKIINNPEDMDNILNNSLSEQEKKELNLAIFVKENTIYNSAVKLTIGNTNFMNIFNKDEDSNMTIKKAVEKINNYINKDPYTFSKLMKDAEQNIFKPIRDFRAEHKLYDPLVLDLNHDGIINTTQLSDSTTAFYDLDKDGYREQTGWVSPEDGFLIANNQVFGINGTSGYQELKAFDSNNDSKITSTDLNFQTLKVWQDSNQDGIIDEEEVLSLDDLNITEINLINSATHQIINGNTILATSTFTQNNQSYLTENINFQINETITKFENNYDLSNEQINLKGFGKIKDLNITTYENQTFKNWINDNLTDTISIVKNFDLFIKKWANIISPTKDSSTISYSEKIWIVETFTDINQLKSFVEANAFKDSYLYQRTSPETQQDILLQYENLKMNYLTQFIIKKSENNFLGLTLDADNNRLEINNIYKLYADLSNIMNTKTTNEILVYLHILKENDLLNCIDINLINPLTNNTELLQLFKEKDFDHIISDLNKNLSGTEILTTLNNRYNNQFIYLENNQTTVKGQNKTTYLTKGINTITTQGKENVFLLNNGSNTINASLGDKVEIETKNSINTINIGNNILVDINLNGLGTTINSYNNINQQIISNEKLTFINDNAFGTLHDLTISNNIYDDYIKSKTTNKIEVLDTGGNNYFNIFKSKIANLNLSNGTNYFYSSYVDELNLSEKNSTDTIEFSWNKLSNINLKNTTSIINFGESNIINIDTDKATNINSRNTTKAEEINIKTSIDNDTIVLYNSKQVDITDLGGTNNFKTNSISVDNINLYENKNTIISSQYVLNFNLNNNNSTDTNISLYNSTITNISSNKGITLNTSSFQMETVINLNTSEEVDKLTISREKEININDLGGDNVINITYANNTNIKTGKGNDYISYNSALYNTIEAGEGNDNIISLAGEDNFIFDKNHGKDTITNTGGINDKVILKNILQKDITIFMKGNDMLIGTDENNSITIKNQKLTANKIESIEIENGKKLLEVDINKLIQDITSFSTTKGIQITNDADVRKNQDLMTIINNAWK